MSERGDTAPEALLRRDRRVIVIALATLCVLAWARLTFGSASGRMAHFDLFPHRMATPGSLAGMDLASAAPSPAAWLHGALMWVTMMVAMMTPAVVPVVLAHAAGRRHAVAEGAEPETAPATAFFAGYLLIWAAFAALAASLQWEMEYSGVLAYHTLASQSRWLSAGLLIAAGSYQLSSLHAECLMQCRAPEDLLSRNWRPGWRGSLWLGARHGVYCMGCCGPLMALLFVGGVMSLAWMAGLSALVLAQKLLPQGLAIARAAGFAMVAWGVATLVV
jgi:predicted metal-binding membrane protein